MPLGKYYCDYCDKEFLDTPPARKRHLNGVQHKRARALWYDSLKADPTGELLVQSHGNIPKGVCHHFVRTVKFLFSFIFMQILKIEAFRHCLACNIESQLDDTSTKKIPRGMRIIAKLSKETRVAETLQPPVFLGNQLFGPDPLSGNSIGDAGIPRGNLPPSLRPPPDGGYPPQPFIDWG